MSGVAVSDVAMIELGEEREAPVIPRRPPSPRRRRLAGLLVAVVAVVLLGPPTPAPTLAETHVAAEPGAVVDVQDDRLYVSVVQAGQGEPQARTITAYRLPGGERLWQATARLGSEAPILRRFGSVVVLQSNEVANGEVIGIDDEWGTVLWRHPAAFLIGVPPAPGTQQPTALVGTLSGETGPLLQPDLISVIDLRTGAQRWSYRLPSDAALDFDWRRDSSEATRMVTGLRSGRVEVRDLATGQVTAAATLSPPVTPSRADLGTWVTTHDGVVLVYGLDDQHMVSAYGIDRLDHKWTTSLDYTGGALYGHTPCGSLLCLGAADTEVLAVERDTGHVRWRGNWEWMERVGAVLISRPIRNAADGLPPMALLDPATGKQTYELGTWELLSWYDRDEQPILLRRNDPRDRAWFGVLDPATFEIRLLGSIPDAPDDCRGGRGAIVCRGGDGAIGIWRYR